MGLPPISLTFNNLPNGFHFTGSPCFFYVFSYIYVVSNRLDLLFYVFSEVFFIFILFIYKEITMCCR